MIETNIHWFSFELLSLSSPMIVETILYVPAGKIVENYSFFRKNDTFFVILNWWAKENWQILKALFYEFIGTIRW